jgi:NAD+ synthase
MDAIFQKIIKPRIALGPMDLKPAHKEEYAKIVRLFIADRVRAAGAHGIVLGLSGGIDSAVVAKLSADAIGKDKVLAIMMPEKDSNPRDAKDAEEFAGDIGIEHKVVDITPVVDSFRSVLGDEGGPTAIGNIKARCRMVVLYHHSNMLGRLVAGTGNKSELLIGYFTKYGDGGTDMLPIGDLYKTQVYELARAVGIPEKLVQKVPSAGLWKGQTDESELGMSYENLDMILRGFELGLSPEKIAERTGFALEEIVRIQDRVRTCAHKRTLPYIPKLGLRTLGLDWRD